VQRQTPAPARQELQYGKHGTRVTVRNLFGNLPVRVKYRAAAAEQKPEYDRLCAALKKGVTSLLLSWREPVSLQIRDSDNKSIVKVGRHPSSGLSAANPPGSRNAHSRSNHLSLVLNTLTQAGFISSENWLSWIPASAMTSRISIKGAISLDPAPTKRVQFISLGIRPLSAEAGHNELYDEVNRVFSLSSFGTVEDDVVDAGEKIRRQNDKRFKNDGYTNRQLKRKRGVDWYPMFCLRISLRDDVARASEDKFLDNESNLQALIEVLGAMITQWLTVHHFRPRKRRTRREKPDTALTSASEHNGKDKTSSSRMQSPFHRSDQAHIATKLGATTYQNQKQKSPTATASKGNTEIQQQRPFADWSRIKSGKVQFLDTLWTKGQEAGQHTAIASRDQYLFGVESIPAGLLNGAIANIEQQGEAGLTNQEQTDINGAADETMIWTDPTTKQTHVLNSRTGAVMSQNPSRPNSELLKLPRLGTAEPTRSLRLRKRELTSDAANTPWLDGLLQTWDNPIFKPVAKSIQQVSHDDGELEGGHFHCSRIDISKVFNEASVSGHRKLSKEGLRNAQVIAQLDKKFILVKMVAFPDGALHETGTLVLIDQHAADERVRVESLLSELCAPLSNTSSQSQYHSKLGHGSQVAFTILEKQVQFSVSHHECDTLRKHADKFAAWGILFDISSAEPSTARNPQSLVTVTTLPPSIAERCKADPKLLISLLRSTAWKYEEEQLHFGSLTKDNLPTSDNETSPLWLRRLSSCPPSLVELVNSRACRSAIMFNDELRIRQCEELVSQLSKCIFPFMCAHGRPSMVPLIELGDARSTGLGLGSLGMGSSEKSFVEAWKDWKM
jgi:DNA mismatch repair protein MLH3